MPDSNYSLSDLSAVLGGRDGMFGNAGGEGVISAAGFALKPRV